MGNRIIYETGSESGDRLKVSKVHLKKSEKNPFLKSSTAPWNSNLQLHLPFKKTKMIRCPFLMCE